jgi:transmembrane sensor
MNNNTNHIDPELLIKYIAGDASEEEVAAAEQWINSSSEHRKEYEELKLLWDKTSEVADFDRIDAEADWRKVKNKVGFDQDDEVRPLYKSKARSLYYYLSRVAAVLILGIGVVWLISRWGQNKQMEAIVATTGPNEEKEIELPDGSKIFLNENSRISYLEDFENRREIEMEGEAFFEVVKRDGATFRVKAANTITEVLGTTFNVKTFDKQDKAIVTLMTGKVALYKQNDSSERLLMEKGEQATYEKGDISKKKTDDRNVISWKVNKLLFEDTQLTEVIESIEKYFKIKIEVENKSLLNCHYTGTFTNPTLERTFEIVGKTLGAEVKKSGNVYVITGEGCEDNE